MPPVRSLRAESQGPIFAGGAGQSRRCSQEGGSNMTAQLIRRIAVTFVFIASLLLAAPMAVADWRDPDLKTLCCELRMASATPDFAEQEHPICIVLNAGPDIDVTLPACPLGNCWQWGLNSAGPGREPERITTPQVTVAAQSVIALVSEPA